MRRTFHFAMMTAMWFLALAAALTSARYFLVPPRLLLPTEILALSRHHMWILLHIAGGIVAITVGLFQFVGSLRDAYPGIHHAMGYLYLSAVFLAGCAGLWLSPDTRVFAAHGLSNPEIGPLPNWMELWHWPVSLCGHPIAERGRGRWHPSFLDHK